MLKALLGEVAVSTEALYIVFGLNVFCLQKEMPQLLPFILLKNAEVTINFDSVNELLDETGKTAGTTWPLRNWADLSSLVKPPLSFSLI